MRPSVVKWLEALRSGEFSQCSNKLEGNGSYCCLGVACVIAERDGVPVKRGASGRLLGATLNAQMDVRMWLGLTTMNGAYSIFKSLAALNDKGKTFAEIADVIENHYDHIFEPEEVTT